MISANASHPNCMLEWMKWTMTPEVQAEVGIWYGPRVDTAVARSDAKGLGKGGQALVDSVEYSFCGNVDFLNSIYLWKTPVADCGDSRGATCEDYSVWQQKWTDIRGT